LSSSDKYVVLTTSSLNSDPTTKKLVDDFRDYKNNIIPNFPLFGRDTPFTENKQLELSNICKVHIFKDSELYDMNKSQNSNTTDAIHLVYCEHYQNPKLLSVIAVLSPDAHKSARDSNTIDAILKTAEKFHSLDPAKYLNKSA